MNKKRLLGKSLIFMGGFFLLASCKNGSETPSETLTDATASDVDPEETTTNHEHSFTNQVIENAYIASPRTCQHVASYYYSCECGEKGEETFTPEGQTLAPHDIDATGRCSYEGCSLNYSVDVTDLNETVHVPSHDGYVYFHLPRMCMWNHVHVTNSNSYEFTDDFDVVLGTDTGWSIHDEFTVDGNQLYATPYSGDTDLYFKVYAGTEESLDLSFSFSSAEENHSFPTLAAVACENEKFFKYCVRCNSKASAFITPEVVTGDTLDAVLYGTEDNPLMYVYKFTSEEAKYISVTASCAYSIYTISGNDMLDYTDWVNGSAYLVLDGITSEANVHVSLITPTEAEESDTFTGGNAYKIKKSADCVTPDLSYMGLYSIYDSYDFYYEYSTDSVIGDYYYFYASGTNTYTLENHVHSFGEEDMCACGLSSLNYISRIGSFAETFIGRNTLKWSDLPQNVTLTSVKDSSLILNVYDADDNLIATGTGTVTFDAVRDYYVVFDNTVSGNYINITLN